MKRLIAIFLILVVGIFIAVNMISEAQLKTTPATKTIFPIPSCFISKSDISRYKIPSTFNNICEDHVISNFSLINQLGDSVGIEIIENKIAIVDFFYVSCPSICPKMTSQLKRVHDHFIDNDKVMILSHTVWPEIDSVEVLLDYSLSYGANPNKWQFLTGEKKELYRMARQSYLVVADISDTLVKKGGELDFIHTENVVLIDTKKRIRGIYDGTSTEDVSRLLSDIDYLSKEKEGLFF